MSLLKDDDTDELAESNVGKTDHIVREADLHGLIDRAGRLKVAQELGMSYSSLTNKMGGYIGWRPGEQARALEIAEDILSTGR